MQITYTATIYYAGPRVALEVVRTCDGHVARGRLASRFLRVGDAHEVIRVLAGEGHFLEAIIDLTEPDFAGRTRDWPEWSGHMPRFVIPQVVEALDGGLGQPATRDELIHALEAVYVELGRYDRWKISTLRLDIVRTALRNSGVAL